MEPTRDRIVAAARRLFAERGYRGATTSEIARAAGVAEGTIYRHFKDKKELFLACVEPAVSAAVDAALQMPSGQSPREVVRQRIAARVAVIQEHLDAFNILFTEAPYHPELADLLVDQVLMPRTAGMTRLLDGPMPPWLARVPSPLILGVGLTAAIWAMLNTSPRTSAVFRSPLAVEQDRLVDDLTEFVLYGIAGRPDPVDVSNPGASPGVR